MAPTTITLFEHDKSVHENLGGGKVADILLWRNRKESAALFLWMTVIWFLFEILEYNLVTIISRFFIAVMLVLYIWFLVANIFEWKNPHVPEIILQESFFNDLAFIIYRRFNSILPTLFLLTCIPDLPYFFMIIVFLLYVVSVIGSYFSFINLLYIGYICMQTLALMFERYGEEINNLFGDIMLVIKKMYRKFDENYLRKILRGPLKEKKGE
ncbi:reticulon-like protein B9 [Vicia villosa]|uniref:reticulon-like protein B9 n=1 Tax=Vicia villosa TaxID=3911 RepID=UPI00273B8449|nr:reticulon-like protein B9 [Vicia villosa]